MSALLYEINDKHKLYFFTSIKL